MNLRFSNRDSIVVLVAKSQVWGAMIAVALTMLLYVIPHLIVWILE